MNWIYFTLFLCWYSIIFDEIIDFLSFLNGIWGISLLSSIWQEFQVNFESFSVVSDNIPKFLFLIKLSIDLHLTKILKCCMIKVLITEIEYNVVIPRVHSTYKQNAYESLSINYDFQWLFGIFILSFNIFEWYINLVV